MAAADEQPAVQHGLAGIRRVFDAGETGDRGDRTARLVGCQAAELDRRDDAVAGRPGARASPAVINASPYTGSGHTEPSGTTIASDLVYQAQLARGVVHAGSSAAERRVKRAGPG